MADNTFIGTLTGQDHTTRTSQFPFTRARLHQGNGISLFPCAGFRTWDTDSRDRSWRKTDKSRLAVEARRDSLQLLNAVGKMVAVFEADRRA